MIWLAFIALTTIAAFASYLAAYSAGYSAGEREQMRSCLRDIEVLRRAEDDRAYADLLSYAEVDRLTGETYDDMLASVLDRPYERHGRS